MFAAPHLTRTRLVAVAARRPQSAALSLPLAAAISSGAVDATADPASQPPPAPPAGSGGDKGGVPFLDFDPLPNVLPPPKTSAPATSRSPEHAAPQVSTPGIRRKPMAPFRRRQTAANAGDKASIAIFKDVVGKSDGDSPPSPPTERDVRNGQVTEILIQLDKSNLSVPEKVDRFLAEVWPHVEPQRGILPRTLFLATMSFLARSCIHVARHGPVSLCVELSGFCARLGKMDLALRANMIAGMCYRILSTQSSAASSSSLSPADGTDAAAPDVDPALVELVNMWKHISQMRRMSQRGVNIPLAFVLPKRDEVLAAERATSNSAPELAKHTVALANIFIQFPRDEAMVLIPALLATLTVLNDPQLAHSAILTEAAPLVELVAAILSRDMPDEAWLDSLAWNRLGLSHGRSDNMRAHVHSQWPFVCDMLQDTASMPAPGQQGAELTGRSRTTLRPSAFEPPAHFGLPMPSALGAFHARLRVAYRARSPRAMISVWGDLRARMSEAPELASQMRKNPEFIDFCIFVWCAMRRPTRLQETLSIMGDLGLEPTIKSYTAMLHGWKICKDTDKATALWDKLIAAGVQLDTVIWTERISGLIEGGRPQEGLRALAKMMDLWKRHVEKEEAAEEKRQKRREKRASKVTESASPTATTTSSTDRSTTAPLPDSSSSSSSSGTRSGTTSETTSETTSAAAAAAAPQAAPAAASPAVAVQPTIEVVNAAITGLIHLDPKAADDVLAWAGRHAIEPNVRTFNIMIRQSFRTKGADDVHKILRTMTVRGIEPDAATFTIILEEILSGMNNASAAEQVQAVEQVLAEMEASCLRANGETYAKMLYAIASLKDGGADEAIEAVQRHMRASGQAMTPHAITILLERALGRDPPTPGAVLAILREHGLTAVKKGDQTLWERVASALAVTGDVDAAMVVRADLERAGRPITSLPCLRDVTKALLAEGRRDDARALVAATIGHKAVGSGGGGGGGEDVDFEAAGHRYWSHRFWHMAADEGLIDWQTAPLELRQVLMGKQE